MKRKCIILLGLLYSFTALAQTDGWYLYTKASNIIKIVPDDVNSDELHLATDIGYIKYNTTAGTVTDFLNLTTQDPAIGRVHDVALDPTSNDIAFALPDGIGVYDGSGVTVYNYENSNLSIGEFTNPFFILELEYAKDGSLYIFKEDAFGYQKFNNGSFEVEEVTAFRTKDIVENNAGTKVYFAGSNNGLWELEKATDIWTNYTSSNSDLANDFTISLQVDANDLLYIGGFQGLNTLSSAGAWNTYQAPDPINGFPYQVHDISINETNGNLVVNTSAPSTYFYGLSIVDLSTNTWVNYREDDMNCLNENLYTATAFGGDGKVYAAPTIFSSIPDIGKLVEFTPSTETCTNANINYLNAPVAVNSNVVGDFSIRKKENGNLDIGFTRTFDFHYTEINPLNFNGAFSTATTLTPSPGNFIGNVISDNDQFIIDTNTGWIVYNESDDITTVNHNLPDYLSIITKKANVGNSDNGILTLVHKGFDAAFNYRVYKTQCDFQNGLCSTSEEIFTNDRDFTQDVNFGCVEDIANDQIMTVGVKTNSSGEVKRTKESWVRSLNNTPLTIWEEDHPIYPLLDVITIAAAVALGEESSGYVNDENTIQLRTENINSSEINVTDVTLDLDNDNIEDEIIRTTRTELNVDEATNIVYVLLVAIGDRSQLRVNQFRGINDEAERLDFSSLSENNDILDARLNTFPKDLFVKKFEIIQYTSSEVLMALFTNYGLLIKSGISVSQFTLNNNEISSNSDKVLVFPNPTKGMVNIGDESINRVMVYDINGREVLRTDKSVFSLKHLENGIYLIKAKNSIGRIINRKIIKH
ncbi:T9SS type A sorting domain-containing protein [Winogradskyella sp. PG-2]|uniref:T9SS type A sorting domain-containing protein n=1 Tax=Winogradskyella sp. PG-2 TaxID=754409 RepID=UPI0004587D8D|nr:T9SS type A sorting domain-containing protein [Winogradskyella sp. PG-2]BAO75528.1 hypothetical protein WPG_1298 [Winogradskyella sp. PG-2]